MTLTVFGPGLVGSYLGAAARAATCIPGPSGRIHGRRVELPTGERTWSPARRLLDDHPHDAPLLIACRIPHTPWNALPPLCVAAQNGLGQPCAVAVCFLALDRDADGIVRHHGPSPRVVIHDDPAWESTVSAWRSAGIQVDQRRDVRPAQWEKAALNATVGPLCLALGLGMAEVWHDPALRAIVQDATAEAIVIAAGAGVTMDDGVHERVAAFFAAAGAHRPTVMKSANELPWVLGALLTHARQSNIRTSALTHIAMLVERQTTTSSVPG